MSYATEEIYYNKEIISLDELSELMIKHRNNIENLFSELEKYSVCILSESRYYRFIIRTKEEFDTFYTIDMPAEEIDSMINKYKPGDYIKLKGDNKSILVVTDYPVLSDGYADRLAENILHNPLESVLFNEDLLMVPCYGTVNGVLAGCNCDGFISSNFHVDKIEKIPDDSFPWINPVANCIYQATMDFEDNNFNEKYHPAKFVSMLIDHEDDIDFWCFDKKSNNFVYELYRKYKDNLELI